MIANLKELMALAEAKCAAVPAFNCYNVESVMAVTQAARDTNAPVIYQLYTRMMDTEAGPYVAAAAIEGIRQLKTPAALHLDHGAGIPQVIRALRLGASSVMIDASTQPLERNIAITKEVVDICKEARVYVEGELGHVGGAADEKLSDFTDVGEAVVFARETGVAALAVMVGTAHGIYKNLLTKVNSKFENL